MKTIEDYQKELQILGKQHTKICNKMGKISREITKLKDAEDKVLIEQIPVDTPEKITKEQWQWILYHWHDETQKAYNTRTNILDKFDIYASGINGGKHSDQVKQFAFTISISRDIVKIKQFFNYIKDVLNCYPSPIDETPIFAFQLYFNVYGWDWEYDGVVIEFDIINNRARFAAHYKNYHNVKEWVSIDESFDIIDAKMKERIKAIKEEENEEEY